MDPADLKKDVDAAIKEMKKAKTSQSPEYLTPIENGILVLLRCMAFILADLEKSGGS